MSLTRDLEVFVQTQIETGNSEGSNEVVRLALRIMEDQHSLNRLRAAIDEADADFEHGDFYELTPELVKEMTLEGERMVREGIEPNPDVCP